jgi:glycosyltransferase involved in cell wall biosynthesis
VTEDVILNSSKIKLSILHLVISIGETNAAYNEHCLPLANERQIAICTYFPSTITPPANIRFYPGDGSINGFFHRLRAALDAKHYDVIHVHSPHLAMLFLIATWFGKYRLFAKSAVVTVHDSYVNYKLRNRLLFLPVFASSPKVICCSRASFNSFPALYKWIAGERLAVVQNGLDIARVDRIAKKFCDQAPVQTNNFSVVAISRLVDIKNPFAVLSGFQQSMDQNSRLTYIGEGSLRHALTTMSQEIGVGSQVEFTGLIPREKVFEHLLKADLFVSTSRGEGLPIAVLEAMACSRPVLLSDISPHREIAENVDFIPLVPPDDVRGFAQKIKKFAAMSPEERAMIGQKCRELVEKRFSLDAMHAGYEAIYTQIISRQPIRSERSLAQ